ncbi:MAG TPA: YdgA family protein [Steroidobacteraceae bacterium]|nr:YdgA family protein [Steroidobacteraceae bacterium]
MGAKVRNVLIAAVALAAIYTGAAWAIGARVQSELQQREQQLLASVPYVRIVSRDYRRGIYQSSEQVTYGIGGPMAQSLRLTPAGRSLLGLQLTIHERIRHGPLPGFSSFALATVDTQVQLPPALEHELRARLGGRAPLQIHSVLDWLGGGRVELTSPALQMRAADGSTIDWQGLVGRISFTQGMRTWSMTMSVPGLSASGHAGGQGEGGSAALHVQLTGLRVSSQGQLAYDSLHLGHTTLTLQQLQIQPTSGSGLRLLNVAYDTTAKLDGDYIDGAAQLSAASVQAAGFSATQVDYAQRLSHVHGPAVAAFAQAMRNLQASAGEAAARTDILQAFQRFGTQVALHAPVLQISRAGFVTPQGQLQFSGRLTMPGLQAADLQGPVPMLALLRHLQVSADLRADVGLVNQLLSGPRGAALAAQLAVLEGQGYLKRDGGAYVSHLSLQDGRISFNGEPYPPLPGAPRP